MSKIKFGIAALKAAEENYQILLERLLKGYKKFTGKEAEGLDRIKIQQEAKKRAEDSAKVVDMEGRNLDPSKNIMGGTQDFEVEESFSLSNKPARAGFGKPPTPINKKVADLKEKELMESKTPFTDRVQAEIGDVTLYGDETFDELEIIRTTGKHPRIEKSEFALGGRVNLQLGGIPLTEKGQNIYDSMTRAGFDEMAIAQALDEQQVAPEITTPGLQQEAVAPPRIQPILPINQGDSSGITTNINRSNPNFDYEFAALGNLANPNNVALTEEEQKQLNFQKGKDGLMSFAKGLGYAINPLGFFAKKGYDFYQNKVRDAQYQKDEADRMKKFKEEKAAALAFEEERLANTAFQNAMANPTAFYASLNDGAGATSTASSRSEAGTDDTPGTPFANGGLATMFVRRG